MNLMWAYFHLRPELISMFVMNNDLQVSPFGTFTRFNRCIQSIPVSVFPSMCPPHVPRAAHGSLGDGARVRILSPYPRLHLQGPAVVSAMSDSLGTGGGLAIQDAESPRHVKTYGRQVPEDLRGPNLPGTLEAYSDWLADALAPLNGNTSLKVGNLYVRVWGGHAGGNKLWGGSRAFESGRMTLLPLRVASV